jgi:hypothetical protein
MSAIMMCNLPNFASVGNFNIPIFLLKRPTKVGGLFNHSDYYLIQLLGQREYTP